MSGMLAKMSRKHKHICIKSVCANQTLTSVLKVPYRKCTRTYVCTHTHVVNSVSSKKIKELRYHCVKVSENQNTLVQGLATNFSKDSGYHSIKFSLSLNEILTIIEL